MENIVVGTEFKLQLWNLIKKEIVTILAQDDQIACSRQDPHNINQIVFASQDSIKTADKRSGKQTSSFLAHEDLCLSLSVNPNKLHTVASTGADSCTRIWDLRKPTSALVCFEDYGHWTSCCNYNQFHDQLLLTGGTSTFAHLYRAQSCSSLPQQGDLEQTFNMSIDMTERSFRQSVLASTAGTNNAADKLVLRTELEDSVTHVEWSLKDAWVYAAAAHNGTVICGTVPSKEKYRILL